ncbi:MAG: hypothetical protein K2J47_10185 [Ruminococcus sp.]|nr:hypothetical protein [Ruminococcus sp.]
MKIKVGKISMFNVIIAGYLIIFGFGLVHFDNPVTGVILVFLGLIRAFYLTVWKMKIDTDTGEFYCREPFRHNWSFHISEIRYFHILEGRQSGFILEPAFRIFVYDRKITVPAHKAKKLKQYLENYKYI